jgi:cell division protein FtsL
MSPPKGARRWSNRPVVRERDHKRSRWRWIVLAWFLAAAAPLTAYMLEQMEYVRSLYKVEELRVQYDRLNEMEQRLLIERQELQAPARVERRAKRDLGLVRPTPRDVVVVHPAENGQGELVAGSSTRR